MNDSAWSYLPDILANIGHTFELVALTLLISTVLAALLTPLTASSRGWIRMAVHGYAWVGRSVPPLTLLFVAFYGLAASGVPVPAMFAAVAAFTFFTTAYNVEIFRGGFQAVPTGQTEAAKALGIPTWSRFVKIIIPQMVPIVSPAYLSNATTVLKDSAIASVVGVIEITAATRYLVQANPGDALALYAVLGLIYLALCSVLIGAQHWLEHRAHQRLAS